MQQFEVKSLTSPVTGSQVAGVGNDFPLLETNGYYATNWVIIPLLW